VERHVTLLGILAWLWGAMALVVGLSMLLLAGGAAAELMYPARPGFEFAAGLTAATFALVGVLALAWGGAHVYVAALLKRRRPSGRVFALALALVNLLVLPFGTALGVYALWVLLTDDGRRLFEPGRVATSPTRG
jgi:hypothetical protein